MLAFEKKYETIERVENFGGFLLLRQLQPNDSILNMQDAEIITDIISSKFHYWEGEKEPSGLTVGMSSSDKYKNVRNWTLEHHKFYGFFDNSKIKHEHYKLISLDNFQNDLLTAIRTETDNDPKFIDKATVLLKDRFAKTTSIYYLDLDKKINADMVAEWQVYDFFYAFIAIDRQKNIVTLIEFGLD